ncbi:hypothetical protein JHK82_014796 [Glycine max]|nr:hypothetical protein JHK85_015163 [Glycine max]KAG5147915.1 hypothetical protein JHK82_014796 [Glycine max]KHN09029.1 hypothetical protein glysoja_021851 [Glycine soja]
MAMFNRARFIFLFLPSEKVKRSKEILKYRSSMVVKVYIVYCIMHGHVERLAKAMVKGVRYYGATSGGLNQQRTGVNLWTLEIILVKQGIVHLEVPVQK